MNGGPPPKPNLFLLWINSHKFHYFGIMEIYSFFILKKYWKWEFWKLNLKFGKFEKIFEDGLLKIKFGNWNFGRLFENDILKIKFGILEFWKIIWKWYFKKLNLKIWNFGNFGNCILKIKFDILEMVF